jgi:hypothetical protein
MATSALLHHTSWGTVLCPVAMTTDAISAVQDCTGCPFFTSFISCYLSNTRIESLHNWRPSTTPLTGHTRTPWAAQLPTTTCARSPSKRTCIRNRTVSCEPRGQSLTTSPSISRVLHYRLNDRNCNLWLSTTSKHAKTEQFCGLSPRRHTSWSVKLAPHFNLMTMAVMHGVVHPLPPCSFMASRLGEGMNLTFVHCLCFVRPSENKHFLLGNEFN